MTDNHQVTAMRFVLREHETMEPAPHLKDHIGAPVYPSKRIEKVLQYRAYRWDGHVFSHGWVDVPTVREEQDNGLR